MKLENWELFSDCGAYTAPEEWHYHLSGNVYGHPSFEDGLLVTTSRIVGTDVDRKVVLTKSGSEYELGDISAEYQEWLDKNKPGWNIWEVRNF